MILPGGTAVATEATKEAFGYLREMRERKGHSVPPPWESLSIAARAEWTAATMLALDIGAVALIADLCAWADEKDISGGLAAAIRTYATSELKQEVIVNDDEEGNECHLSGELGI
jgi:hypothetical protein